MVTRKPLPQNAAVDPNAANPSRIQDARQELWTGAGSDTESDKVWGDRADAQRRFPGEGTDQLAPQDVPDSLRPGGSRQYSNFEDDEESAWREEETRLHPNAPSGQGTDLNNVPAALRPGVGVSRTETNPFKRKPSPAAGREEAIPIPPAPTSTPPVPPAGSFSQLSLNENSNNPWKPALDDQKPTAPAPPPFISNPSDQDSGPEVWGSKGPSRAASTAPASTSPALISLPSEDGSAAWDESPPHKPSLPPLPPVGTEQDQVLEDSHAWDDLGTQDKGKAPMKPPRIPAIPNEGTVDGWNLIDGEPAPGPPSRQSTWENFVDAEEALGTDAPAARQSEEHAPALPPRNSAAQPPPQPPRPVAVKNETYQIKNINWYDATAAKNPRTSPILVQNANGPCPLMALVNALTLTTPAELQDTALVETLRTREQVSLNLLLDAVLDELMSPRRTNPDVPLPDVLELYEFLKGLHTGMNVNPRFIPTPEIITAFKRTSLVHLHPTERGDLIPGTFEDTREMKFYATFSIPLIHGWIPPKSDAVYGAFERRAASYEDAQNLLFREEELEEKLSSSSHRGLTEEEQEVYQDILTIKSFLSISATQLTPWGLEVITKATRPGSVAILFRNDHFSTLYRHPQTHELLGLVTDAGYASHAEVVWESLVDVNGEHAEFFSGDFRVVGGPNQHGDLGSHSSGARNENASTGREGDWTTVQGRGRNRHSTHDEPPLSPKHEQEDRDLALALQLQEEEDERHRAEQAQRRRESILSEQYIEQQGRPPAQAGRGGQPVQRGRGRGGPIAEPGRRSSSNHAISVTTTNSSTSTRGRGGGAGSNTDLRRGPARPVQQQQVRPLVPPAAAPRNTTTNRPVNDDLDDAPPSYEQASKQAAYVPPSGHPSHPASNPGHGAASPVAGPSTPSASSTRLQNPGAGPTSPTFGRGGLRQGISPAAAGNSSSNGRDKDCVVM